MNNNNPLVGFIGQGWIGKNYADNFEARGFSTVRYALEAPYAENKNKIKDCDIVFIAVPTPTTPAGFDGSIVRAAVKLVGLGKIAVIKSTVLPGTTKDIQKENPEVVILYSPEFLSESTAAHDTANPFSNIVGLPIGDDAHQQAATLVHNILPPAKFTLTCDSTEGEFIKYSHNLSGYVQIIFFNMIYDLAKKLNCDWSVIHQAIVADPFIPNRYSEPVHKSGRGAGGGCFIKDFEALKGLYQKTFPDDKNSLTILEGNVKKNIELLIASNKDTDLLKGVYGEKLL